MTELKTLREIATEVGFPFEAFADCQPANRKLFLGFDRAERIVGVRQDNTVDTWLTDSKIWTLFTPKPKLVEVLYEEDGLLVTSWQRQDEYESWMKKYRGIKFIKILREVEL